MARTVTKETTFVKAPSAAAEIALLFKTDEQESDMLFELQRDGRYLIGYLIHDEDAQDPSDGDGEGHIYTSNRRHNKESNRGFQQALGLDSDYNADWDLISSEEVVAAAHAAIEADPELLAKCRHHAEQHWRRPLGQAGLDFVKSVLKDENELTPVIDLNEIKGRLWAQGRQNGTIGAKYAVLLDVYEHGLVQYSVSGEGMQCRFDTARGGAVWVPDACAIENFEDPKLDLEANRAKAREYAKSCVEAYTDYANGNCYGAVVQYSDGEQVEGTLWSLIGRDNALSELKELFKQAPHDPKPVSVEVPELDIDKVLYKNHKILPRTVRERRIVANMIAHLERAGFKLMSVDDTDEDTCVSNMKEAMELIFDLDLATVFFKKDGFETQHGVALVLGNDLDVICDYSYSKDDVDGFQAAMDDFNAEDYA